MATITLSANTDYSSLTVANGDTIDCNGFRLTIDEQPTEENIEVITPSKAGTVVFSSGWEIPTWNFTAGTVPMIVTLPSGAHIGCAKGGTATNARGVTSNDGGIIEEAVGGSAVNCHGVLTNVAGTLKIARGASVSTGCGCSENRAVVEHAIGGANFSGINVNNGTVLLATGGGISSSRGINVNSGIVLRIKDETGPAVNVWRGTIIFMIGDQVRGEIKSPIDTIYTLGPLHDDAVIPGGATVIELSEGSAPPIAAGFTGIRGLSRRIGA